MYRSKKLRREAEELVYGIMDSDRPSSSSQNPSPSTSSQNTSQPVPETFENEEICLESLSSISSSDSLDSNVQIQTETLDLSKKLGGWAIEHLITNEALRDLLDILSKEGINLPKDPRTQKKSPKENVSVPLDDGEYVHYGLKDGLTDFLISNKYEEAYITLDFNVDGLPVAKSSRKQVWPILCNVVKTGHVFIVGVYSGLSKPKVSDTYLPTFVSELKGLIDEGMLWNNKVYPVIIRAFIFDAPARSFVLKNKGHTGYYGCIKCIQKGTLVGRKVIYPFEINECRTNETYRLRIQAEHHHQIHQH